MSYDGLTENVTLQVKSFITELFLDANENLLLKLRGCINPLSIQYQLQQLACDYECFFDSATLPF